MQIQDMEFETRWFDLSSIYNPLEMIVTKTSTVELIDEMKMYCDDDIEEPQYVICVDEVPEEHNIWTY